MRKLLQASQLVETESLRSDSWNHRTFRAVRMSTEVNFEIVPAALGDDAPLWGAVALAEDVLC